MVAEAFAFNDGRCLEAPFAALLLDMPSCCASNFCHTKKTLQEPRALCFLVDPWSCQACLHPTGSRLVSYFGYSVKAKRRNLSEVHTRQEETSKTKSLIPEQHTERLRKVLAIAQWLWRDLLVDPDLHLHLFLRLLGYCRTDCRHSNCCCMAYHYCTAGKGLVQKNTVLGN